MAGWPWHPRAVFRDDFLLRQIQQAIDAIERAFFNRDRGDYDAADADIERGYSALLEHNRTFLGAIDDASLARLVGDPDKLRALARLCRADGDLRAERGDAADALVLYRRARTLLREARGRGVEADDEALLAELDALIAG